MWNTPEFKVGFLVVLVSGLIGTMSLKVAEGPGLLSGSSRYWFDIEDAGGLVKNSGVKMAGIKVGIIEDIELVNGVARVRLLLDSDTPLTVSSQAELRADGILGDKHVELVPGKLGDPLLKPGEIQATADKGSLDKVMNQVGEIAQSLKDVASTLEAATKTGDRTSTLGRILSNIEMLTADLADMSGANKQKINSIVDQVHSITKTLDHFVNDDSPEGFKVAWQSAVDSLKSIDKTLNNFEEISDKINRGEGTIGRLVNEEETVDGINEALTSVNEFLGGASSMETSIDFHSEYLASASSAKSYLNVKVQPGLDRYYLLGIVDDPRGVSYPVSTTNSLGTTEETKTYKNDLKFTVQFAKNFYDFTVRGGIIESSGGLGLDYHFLNRKLTFSVEAFNFDELHLRSYAKYTFLKGIYLVGGGDDLTDKDFVSGFIGGGIFITNDDLKTLASKVSF